VTLIGFDTVFTEWQQFLDHLQEMDVLEATSLRRIINGTQLAEALHVRPGKWMAAALNVCVAWQFRNPNSTDPAEAVEEVRRRAEELGLPLNVSSIVQK
jgi:hypothetical protein